MLRHILLFKFRPETSELEREQAFTTLVELGEQCPTVIGWSVGKNIANSPRAYDMAEVADFNDEAGLVAYKEHPAHREASVFLGAVATWALVDYSVA
jgi:stress responsive alpha/beta barrel protein